jgi:hypothetical protein
MKLGRFIKVMEKWVFFKLLFANLTDSSGGKNHTLQAIKMMIKYFKTSEIIQLLTSNFYSKLYYCSEIWHVPTLNSNCKKLLLSASANALKLCNAFYHPSISYVDLHKLHKQALPNNFCTYRPFTF